MAALCYVSYVAGNSGGGSSNGVAVAETAAGLPISAMKKVLANAAPAARDLLLPSGTAEQRAEIDSWVDFASGFTAQHLESLDQHLKDRAFLAGSAFTLADIAVYFACAAVMAAAEASSARKTLNFSRWFNQVQHRVRTTAPDCTALPPIVSLDLFSPVTIPLPPVAASPSAAPRAAAALPPIPKGGSDGSGGGGDGVGAEKHDKNKKGEGKDKGKVAAPSKGKSKASGAPAPAPAPAAAVSEEGDPSKLDMRVGVIVKAWEHPDSDKLFCEEIDLGEAKTRMIASGLRSFYTLEEMQKRRVVVLANLKPRNIGGFKSEGMVLCASNADHTAVKTIEPPAGAAPGARVTVQGTEGEPATPSQIQKKKILEKCAPKLRVNAEGLPAYGGAPFNVDGATCGPTMVDAIIS